MPLDPFFAERLRVHRRYLVGKTVKDLRARVTALWNIERAQPAAPAKAPAGSPGSRARAKHRRAALAWDRTELETVGTPGPQLRISEHEVPVPGYPSVRVRVYHPPQADGPAPACLTFFGGAFRIGGIDYPTTDAACRRRAADAGIAMVAVDYALAPEHRYPTQVRAGPCRAGVAVLPRRRVGRRCRSDRRGGHVCGRQHRGRADTDEP